MDAKLNGQLPVGLASMDPTLSGWDEVVEAEADQLWQKAVSSTEAACGRFHEASSIVRINSLAAKHLPNERSNSNSKRSSFENSTPSKAPHGAIAAIRAELLYLEDSLGKRHVCTLNARVQLAYVLEFQGMLEETDSEWQIVVEGHRWVDQVILVNTLLQDEIIYIFLMVYILVRLSQDHSPMVLMYLRFCFFLRLFLCLWLKLFFCWRYRHASGEASLHLALALSRLASCRIHAAHYTKAAEAAAEAARMMAEATGADSPQAGLALVNQALASEAASDAAGAEEAFKRAVEVYSKVYGKNNWRTKQVYVALAALLSSQGRDDEAQDLRVNHKLRDTSSIKGSL